MVSSPARPLRRCRPDWCPVLPAAPARGGGARETGCACGQQSWCQCRQHRPASVNRMKQTQPCPVVHRQSRETCDCSLCMSSISCIRSLRRRGRSSAATMRSPSWWRCGSLVASAEPAHPPTPPPHCKRPYQAIIVGSSRLSERNLHDMPPQVSWARTHTQKECGPNKLHRMCATRQIIDRSSRLTDSDGRVRIRAPSEQCPAAQFPSIISQGPEHASINYMHAFHPAQFQIVRDAEATASAQVVTLQPPNSSEPANELAGTAGLRGRCGAARSLDSVQRL